VAVTGRHDADPEQRVPAARPPVRLVRPGEQAPAERDEPGASDLDASGRAPLGPIRGALAALALLALCLVVADTALGFLPDDALAAGTPVLSVLTVPRLFVVAALICLAVVAPRPSTFLTPADLPLLGLAGVAVWATWSNGQAFAPVRGLLTAVAVYYLTVGVLRTHRDAVPVLLVTLLGAAFGTAAVGVQQYVDGVDTTFYRDGLTNTDESCADCVTRSIGTFSNPNLLAGFLVLALPPAAVLLGSAVGRRMRIAWVLMLVVGAAGLVVTFSRGAVASAVVILAIATLVIVAGQSARGDPAAARSAVMAIAAAVVVGVVVVGAATGLLGERTGRDELWSAALDAARSGGIDGVGYGRAGDVMSELSGDSYAHAHNLLLNWLVDVGPLGPVLVGAFLIVVLAAGARRAAHGSLPAAGAVAGVSAILLASVLDHPTTVSSLVLLLLVVSACAVAGPSPLAPARGGHVAGASGGPVSPGADPDVVPGPGHSPSSDAFLGSPTGPVTPAAAHRAALPPWVTRGAAHPSPGGDTETVDLSRGPGADARALDTAADPGAVTRIEDDPPIR
jgi:O-antigen ligase